jgi:hypothetical protein
VNTAAKRALERIWADATSLAKVIDERAERLCGEALASRGPNVTPETAPASNLAALAQATLGLQYHVELNAALPKAIAEVTNDLVAGRLVALGRPASSHAVKRIDASFWIGADVDPLRESVTRGARKLMQVRVVSPEKMSAVEPTPQAGVGRPSKAEVIRAAIREHAKSDPGLNQPRSQRYRRYHAYISSQGYDPKKEAGFTEKTLEKYEREYRLQNS